MGNWGLARLCAMAGALFAAVVIGTTPSQAQDASDILITNVRLLDIGADTPQARDGQEILISRGRIVAIAAAGELEPSIDAAIIDGGGRTLLPGLTDMHVHIWDEAELGAYLAAGVTTVRNMSGMPYLLEMRDRIAAGELAGPRIVTTGPILNSPGANAQLNHQIVETADEARSAVRMQHEQGYRRIKVYSNLTPEAYQGIREEAARLDLPISGHTPEGRRTQGIPQERPFEIDFDAILNDGFETIEHVESIVWHGLRNRQDEAAARALAQRIAAAGVPVDATLIAFANLVRIAQTQGAHLTRSGTDTLNPFIQSMETAQSERWSNEDVPRAEAQLAFFQLFTRMLAEEGVLIVAGSDAGIATNIPGASLHDELDLLVESGLTVPQALQAATVNAARAMGEEEATGRIEPGYETALILVDGDPLADIAVLRNPVAVVAGGVVYRAEDLARMREAARQTNPDRTAANVLGAMAAQGTEVQLSE